MIRTLMSILHNIVCCGLNRTGGCKPLFPLYHMTPFCNLKCAYCDGFPELGLPGEKATGWNAVDEGRYQLSTADVKALIGILKHSFDFLFLTGGEPLVRRDVEEIIDFAGSLGFTGISINTNSILLPEKEGILKHVSNLVVSLDMLDAERYSGILGCDTGTVKKIIGNVERYKECEREYGYKLSVHTVILPGKIHLAEDVLDFCLGRDIAVCLSPLQIDYDAHASFEGDTGYRRLIDRLIGLKKSGGNVSGTVKYYENIRQLEKFRCIPILVPRILPNGNILYPCRPKGDIAGNILQLGSWERTLGDAVRRYGKIEECDRSCRIRCYIEPSLIMKHPVSVIGEFLGQL
jgi:MoaA/NifB/PqqE/SkfB family radical SAM enzyme